MQLIAKEHLVVPGICTLCEQAPVDNHEVVDTKRNLIVGFPFHLGGRKYVCQGCVKALGEVIGLVTDEKQKAAIAAQAVAEYKLNALKDRVAKLANELVQESTPTPDAPVWSLANPVATPAPAPKKPQAPKTKPADVPSA